MKLKAKNWFVILSALIPAFSSGEKENFYRLFKFSCDGIGRMVSRKNYGGRWLFPLLGERVRVRADVPSFIYQILFVT
jgi:hypothetical protein